MTTRGIARLVLLAVAGFGLAACEEGGGSNTVASKHDGWIGDWDAAVKEAKASNKPILIDFGAEW